MKEIAAKTLDLVRERNPLIHCITNYVTSNDCANILLSFGASPAMCDAMDEAYGFAQISAALYINFGTYNKEQEMAGIQAALSAKEAGIPIVVDPVGSGAIPRKKELFKQIYRVAGVDVIKGNMGEIMALAGGTASVKGVDSDGEVAGVEEAAVGLAKQYGCVVAATGKIDIVTDGARVARIHGGVEMLKAITGAGCMAGALCAATAAVGNDKLAATVAAIASMCLAGELAYEKAKLPGSFRVKLLDSVYGLTGAALLERNMIEC